jgi:hypothetical protein
MAANGGLEFQRYAGLVAQQLAVRGYQPTTDMKSANMIVQLGYGIGPGQVRIETDPFYEPWSSFYYPRFGYRSAFYYGWGDPFWGRSPVNSFIEYHGQVDMHIRAAGTNQSLFDGRAQARASTNRADRVLPPLIEALFTGFPGRSGEDVRITIPARTY